MREKRQPPERGEIARDGRLKSKAHTRQGAGEGVDVKNDIFALI